MKKLNQVIALVSGKKTKTTEGVTAIYHVLQKPPLFEGIYKTYSPINEDGETQPPEKKNVQYTVKKAVAEFVQLFTDAMDIVATQDFANTTAKADVVVDGKVILKDVPVTTLLYLEKRIVDFQTFIGKLPTLDPGETWTYDDATDSYRSEPARRNSTKKEMKNHVRAAATDKHPAQVDVYTEDVKIGEYTTIKFSGAIEAKVKNEYLSRVGKLLEAVKTAREEANSITATDRSIGKPIFDYLFG